MNPIKKLFGFMDKIIVITVKLLCGDHPEPNKEELKKQEKCLDKFTNTKGEHEFPVRVIPRHSLQTRITHGVVAVSCLWLMVSGVFVFVPPIAAAFPQVAQVMRMSHRLVGAIFIICPIVSALLAPKGFKLFCEKYFVKWTPEDIEFMKKFVFYMIGPKTVHMPDQDEVKSGQRFADGAMVLSSIFIAVSGLVLWLGTSVFRTPAEAQMIMRICHDICFVMFIIFGIAHIYLGAGIFQPYKGTARLMWGDGKVPESDGLYHWGFWAREEIEHGNIENEDSKHLAKRNKHLAKVKAKMQAKQAKAAKAE